MDKQSIERLTERLGDLDTTCSSINQYLSRIDLHLQALVEELKKIDERQPIKKMMGERKESPSSIRIAARGNCHKSHISEIEPRRRNEKINHSYYCSDQFLRCPV